MSPALVASPPQDGRVRVVCFHYAGGGASCYARWSRLLPDANVCPVQLPGREGRASEPRHTEFEPLVQELSAELEGVVDRRTIFYGHSMGALLAYGVARELAASGACVPAALVIGAYPAPHLPPPLAQAQPVHDDARLASVLSAIGGLPQILLEHPEWLEALLPTVRDDIVLCRSYRHSPDNALQCPIHAIAGTDDLLVAAEQVEAWREHTVGEFELHAVAGGHMFVKDSPAQVAAIVRRVAVSAGP